MALNELKYFTLKGAEKAKEDYRHLIGSNFTFSDMENICKLDRIDIRLAAYNGYGIHFVGLSNDGKYELLIDDFLIKNKISGDRFNDYEHFIVDVTP
jgi:hypothetical protein